MLISYGILGKEKLGFIKPGSLEYSSFYVFFVELFFTMIMMMVILSGKHSKLTLFDNATTGIIGSVGGIFLCISCAGNLTGAVFNVNVGVCNITFNALV